MVCLWPFSQLLARTDPRDRPLSATPARAMDGGKGKGEGKVQGTEQGKVQGTGNVQGTEQDKGKGKGRVLDKAKDTAKAFTDMSSSSSSSSDSDSDSDPNTVQVDWHYKRWLAERAERAARARQGRVLISL